MRRQRRETIWEGGIQNWFQATVPVAGSIVARGVILDNSGLSSTSNLATADEFTIVRIVGNFHATITNDNTATNTTGAWGLIVVDEISGNIADTPNYDMKAHVDAPWMIWKPFSLTSFGSVPNERGRVYHEVDIRSKRKLDRQQMLIFYAQFFTTSAVSPIINFTYAFRNLLQT